MELIYTKFVSLIASEPTIQTLLPGGRERPLAPKLWAAALAQTRRRGWPAGALGQARTPACLAG